MRVTVDTEIESVDAGAEERGSIDREGAHDVF